MRGILILLCVWLGIGFLREDKESYFVTSAEIAGKLALFILNIAAWIIERMFNFTVWMVNADGHTQLLGAGLAIFTVIAWKLLCWNIERNLPPSTPWNEDDFDDFDEPPASSTQRKRNKPKHENIEKYTVQEWRGQQWVNRSSWNTMSSAINSEAMLYKGSFGHPERTRIIDQDGRVQ